MSDRLQNLETELANLRPAPIGGDLAGRIAARLAERPRLSWSDRLLVGAMGSGALAACVIAGVLIWPAIPRGMVAGAPPTVAVTEVPRVGDYALALGGSGAWSGRWMLAGGRSEQ